MDLQAELLKAASGDTRRIPPWPSVGHTSCCTLLIQWVFTPEQISGLVEQYFTPMYVMVSPKGVGEEMVKHGGILSPRAGPSWVRRGLGLARHSPPLCPPCLRPFTRWWELSS